MLEFNILLTSFLNARNYDLNNKFSVASWKPNWCTYKEISCLFPYDINGLRLRLRNCENSVDQYVNELREGYSDRWDQIESWLESLKTDEQYILCCWCPHSKPSKESIKNFGSFFCHTTLIGKMIKTHRPELIVKLDQDRELKSIPSTIDWYKIQVKKIISGGQTGADEAGLIAGKLVGLETGGWMPAGFRTSEGRKPEFKELYNIQEHSSYYYSPRTFKNAKESDGTVRFASDFSTAGEICTLKAINQYKRPYFDVDINKSLSEQVIGFRSWLKCNCIKTLNVAGNSEKSSPDIKQKVVVFLQKVLCG
jgi:hypothetical protein